MQVQGQQKSGKGRQSLLQCVGFRTEPAFKPDHVEVLALRALMVWLRHHVEQGPRSIASLLFGALAESPKSRLLRFMSKLKPCAPRLSHDDSAPPLAPPASSCMLSSPSRLQDTVIHAI